MKLSQKAYVGSLIFLLSTAAFAKELKSNCSPGSLSVDQQCVPIGNRIGFYFQTIHSVKRGYYRQKADLEKIEISGRGSAGSFGGSLQNPIPLTVTLILKEGSSDKSDRASSLLQTCQQGALLSLSGKEKYLFSLDLESDRAIASSVLLGGDGHFEIQYDLKSETNEGLLVQCGNALKAQ